MLRLTKFSGPRRWLGWFAAALLCSAGVAQAQYEDGRRPPEVIGPSGHPYGPTQAEYQYQRRYGHPSPNAQPGDMRYVNGYPGGGPSIPIYVQPYGHYHPHDHFSGAHYHGPVVPYGGYQYQATSVYGPGLQFGLYTPFGNVIASPAPMMAAPPPQLPWRPNNPLDDPAFRGDVPGIAPAFATPQVAPPILEPSTPEQQIRGIRLVDQGDKELRRIRYQTAAVHYKNAVAAARDQATPRFRLALTYVGRSLFAEAIEQYKLGLTLDPTWPQHAEQLVDLLGDDNTMARNLLVHRVAEWVNQDIRDPERLFLLVVVLHQNGDPRAQTVLQTAILLAGNQPHLVAFLPLAHGAGAAPASPPQGGPAQPSAPVVNPTPQIKPGPAGPILPLPGTALPTDDVPPPPSVPADSTSIDTGPSLPNRES